ncbi:hypothetical protein GCM10008924_18200 [Gracilibacillus halotolerans]
MGFELPKIGITSLTLDMNVLISDSLSGTLDSTLMPYIFYFIQSQILLSRVGAALSGVKDFYHESWVLYLE